MAITRKQFLGAAGGILGARALDALAAGPAPPAVYPVPPLARRNDAVRSLDFAENEKILRFLLRNGMRHVVYGGNAFLYDITLAEYRELIDWAGGFAREAAILPGIGPSFGRAMDQAPIVRKYPFHSLLVLPSGDPRDARGLEAGLREIANASGLPLSLYIKAENSFGDDREAGFDLLAKLVDGGECISIKYAIARKDPRQDAYLEALLKRVAPERVVCGLGERPAVVHLRDYKLSGFTTGSGVLAPKLSLALLEAAGRRDYAAADAARSQFLPLEDLRDSWGPPRVLHAAVELAGIARTGPIPPYVSALSIAQLQQLGPVARALLEKNG